VPEPKRTRKVAILGFGGTVKDAPAGDPTWELWAMNGFWRAAKPDYGIDVPEGRFSLWFDMHTVEYTREYGKHAGFGDAQERWLEKPHPFPVLMLNSAPEFPSVEAFPIEALVQKVGRDYFTSTVAYALAFALAQDDVAEVGVWGIDLVHDTEYSEQRPCAEYWIGRLEAAGIKVVIHEGSALLKQRARYGYESEPEIVTEIRKYALDNLKSLEGAIVRDQEEVQKLTGRMHTNDGGLQAFRSVLQRLDIWDRGGRI